MTLNAQIETAPHKRAVAHTRAPGRSTVGFLGAIFAAGLAAILLSLPGNAQSDPAVGATVVGFVRDSNKHPIAGASISLQAKGMTDLTAHTDAAGSFRFSAVRSGDYTVRAQMIGYRDATVSSFSIGQNESRTIHLTLDSAKASTPQAPSATAPEFFDEPRFTIAGVTDATSLGGHGSGIIVRNREALAKDTVALRKPSAEDHSDPAAEQHHRGADIDEKQGKILEAVREYQRAAELNPSESNLFDWGAELLLHRAAEPAIEVFTNGNRLFPHSVRMLTGLGAAWYSQGSNDQATQHLCEASDLNPSDPEPYLFMGKVQAADTSPSKAMAERLGRFVKLQPENALANYYYAVSLWKQRMTPGDVANLAQARSFLEKAIRLDAKLAVAHLQLGILYSEQKDVASAISAYRQAIGSAPQLEEAHYRLAQAYRQIGETSKAQLELQEYERITREKADETERQRHELQQLVYQLRDQPTTVPPK